MKKLYFVLILLVVFGFSKSTQAQEVSHELGIQTGINIYFYTNDLSKGFYDRTYVRPNFGIAYQVNLMKRFSVKTSISYQRKVFSRVERNTWNSFYTGPNELEPETSDYYKNSHLFLPVLANWTFGQKVKFFMHVGPSFNYDFGYTIKRGDGPVETLPIESKLTIKYAFGFGFSAPLSEKLLFKAELTGNRDFPTKQNGEFKAVGLNSMLILGVNFKLPKS